MVVFVHCADLSQSPVLARIPILLSARGAVEGFFAISGYLIFASYERSRSARVFFENRAYRILPGYWLSTLMCLAISFATGHWHVGRFLLGNLTFANFIAPGIPGLFEHNPGNASVNGALWTIKIELMFYLAVPAIVWCCRRLKRDAVLAVLFVLSIVYRIYLPNENWSQQLPGELCYFIVGALVYYHHSLFERYGRWLMVAAAALLAAYLETRWYPLRPLSVPLLMLGACLLLPHVTGPTRWGDFSYGTYVLHYPIVQCVVAAGLFAAHPLLATAAVLMLVAAGASFSWFVVEKPSLAHSKSSRVRRAALRETANYPAAVP